MMRDLTALKDRYMRDEVPVRLGNLASNLAHISTYAKTARHPDALRKLIDESRFFIEWTAAQVDAERAAQLVDLQIELCRWYWRWPVIVDDREQQTQLASQARKWSTLVLELSGLLDDEEDATPLPSPHE